MLFLWPLTTGDVWWQDGQIKEEEEEGKVLVALERAPLQKGTSLWGRARPSGGGRALVAYLIGRGLKHLLIT